MDGQELTFGVSGKLIMNALVMYDHQTISLWSQFLGQSVKGPQAGTRLTPLSSQMTTWSSWVDQHPDTLVLDKTSARRGPITSFDPYRDYYDSGRAGILGVTSPDDRLPKKDFVVGLTGDLRQRAYPFRYLSDTPVLNDAFGDTPVVVAFDGSNGAATVFDRRLDQRTLTFEATNRIMRGQPIMTDRETGTTWGMLSGEALAGPLLGQGLREVPSLVSFWFAWKDFHPNTELYEPAVASG